MLLQGVEPRFYILRASSLVVVPPHPPFVAANPIHNSRRVLSVWDILIAVVVVGQDPSTGTGPIYWDRTHILGQDPSIGTGPTYWDRTHLLGQDPSTGTGPIYWDRTHLLGQDPSTLMTSPDVVENNSTKEFYQVPPESYPRWKTLGFPSFKHSCFLFWSPVFSSGSEIWLQSLDLFFLLWFNFPRKMLGY
jgi:hypothetical protein